MDVSKLNLVDSDGKIRVHRRIDEEFQKDCLTPTVEARGGSIMILNGPELIFRINGIID